MVLLNLYSDWMSRTLASSEGKIGITETYPVWISQEWECYLFNVVSRLLFDFDQNENCSKIGLCFHPCTATSIDDWVPKVNCSVN